MATSFRARVLVAEDEEFSLHLLQQVLEDANFQVEAVNNVPEAIAMVASFDPHVVISDLNFGMGSSGADLMQFVEKEHPWVGKVVLTSHASPKLAISNSGVLPAGVTYLVKSELSSITELVNAVEASISYSASAAVAHEKVNDRIIISETQGEILLMLAEGYTNAAIARKRGTSLRATETLVQRTFASLGFKGDEDFNPRVLAVRMWQQGKVVVR